MATAKCFMDLPHFWQAMSTSQRGWILQQLQRGTHLSLMAPLWKDAHYSDRWAVLHYLNEVTGELTNQQIQALVDVQRTVPKTTFGTADMESFVRSPLHYRRMVEQSIEHGIKIHVSRVNRNRMLPSAYTRMNRTASTWVRSSGKLQPINTMNKGHLENSLKLLKESHGNVVARATDLLGRMSMHFGNQSEIKALLEILCLKMQKVEVDDMYPIFDALAKELKKREVPPEVDIDDSMMDALNLWDE